MKEPLIYFPKNMPTNTTIKTSSDGFAMVDVNHVMFDAKDVAPPLNVQIICGNIHSGKSVLSIWNASHGFTHWAGVPVFPKSKKEFQ